jgi:hypothetical protein
MLSMGDLFIVMLIVIMLSVVMPSVMAPICAPFDILYFILFSKKIGKFNSLKKLKLSKYKIFLNCLGILSTPSTAPSCSYLQWLLGNCPKSEGRLFQYFLTLDMAENTNIYK